MVPTGTDELTIVAIDDDVELLDANSRALRRHGFKMVAFSDPVTALGTLEHRTQGYDVVLLDVQMPSMSGFQVLERIQHIDPDLPVVMLTADETADTAVRALRSGAFYYLTKPFEDLAAAAAILREAGTKRRLQLRVRELEQRLERAQGFETLVGSDESMRSVFEVISRVAPLDVNVLILGESGTGKELAARAIHNRSRRSGGPFIALNCSAIPETLVDSELFGHARGAFTGAVEARAGAFERADGGTLFLDEIGDVPAAVQLRLLRVLQEREISRLGGTGAVAVDVRIIAATLSDLELAVERGEFRRDLYYRLRVVDVVMPPLRQRRDDIPQLAAHFVRKHSERLGLAPPRLLPEAIERLQAHTWPGNVRELENVIQRALALTPGEAINTDYLPPAMRPLPPPRMVCGSHENQPGGGDDLAWTDGMTVSEARKRVVDQFERAYVERLTRLCGGSISEAARRAGIDRSNLRRMMQRVGIRPSGGEPEDDGPV